MKPLTHSDLGTYRCRMSMVRTTSTKFETLQIHFLICALGRKWWIAGKRLERQIKKNVPNAIVFNIDQNKLSKYFKMAIDQINRVGGKNTKGFGFWIWKPLIVAEYLKKLPSGSIVFYIDAGCEINSAGKHRYMDYLELTSQNGYLLFSLEDKLEDFCGDALTEKFGLKMENIRNAKVTSATFFAFQNRNCEANPILEEWCRYALNYPSAFTDEGESENSKYRHDQTILSIISVLKEAKLIVNELDNHYSKNEKSDYFVLALRNRLPISVSPGTIGFRLRRIYWALKGNRHE